MTDQMRYWLTRGAIALGIFVVGGLAGWIGRGAAHQGDVSRIAFYQDWRLACPADKEAKASCELASDIVDPKSGTKLAQLMMGQDATKTDKKEVLIVTVPLTVLIAPGVGLQFGSETQTYPYVTCVPSGCIAMVPVDDKLLASLASAKSMSLVVAAENGRTVPLPVSVQGYADAIKALNQTEARRHSWWRRLWS